MAFLHISNLKCFRPVAQTGKHLTGGVGSVVWPVLGYNSSARNREILTKCILWWNRSLIFYLCSYVSRRPPHLAHHEKKIILCMSHRMHTALYSTPLFTLSLFNLDPARQKKICAFVGRAPLFTHRHHTS